MEVLYCDRVEHLDVFHIGVYLSSTMYKEDITCNDLQAALLGILYLHILRQIYILIPKSNASNQIKVEKR